MVLVGIFGAVALLLAVGDIYAIVVYGVVQRTHENWNSYGARRAQVIGLYASKYDSDGNRSRAGRRGGCKPDRDLKSLLFELAPVDVTTFVAMPAIFALNTAVASNLPARRATRLDPQAV